MLPIMRFFWEKWKTGFARNLMEYECPNPKENRLQFCSNVFQKAVTLICNDTDAANREEEKQLMYAEIPF